MTTRKRIPLCLAIFLFGCGTPYVSPPIGGNAVLDFREAAGISGFQFYENGNDCTGNLTLPEDKYPLGNKTKELVLHAEKRVGFNFFFVRGLTSCQVTVSFTPRVDGRYGVRSRWDGDFCYVQVVDRNQGGIPAASSIDLTQMKYVMGLGIRNSCVPK